MPRIFEPLNCAVSCPSNTYTEDEWLSMEKSGLLTSAATLVGSAAIFAYQCYYFWEKPLLFCRLMFLFGFFLTSIVMVLFTSLNGLGSNNITCEGNYAAIQHGPFCEFQAWAMIFLVIWTEMWTFLMAVECYLFVSSAASGDVQAGKFNKIYFLATLAVSSACSFIPLAVGNLGYDIEATAPFCFYMVSETTDYLFATLIYPFTAFAFGCIVFTCATIYKIQKTFVLHDKYTDNRQSHITRETEFTTIRESTQIRLTAQSFTSEVTSSPFYQDASRSVRNDMPTESSFVNRPNVPETVYKIYQRDNIHASEVETANAITPHPRGYWSSALHIWKKTWQYNGRQLMFVVTFVMATAFIVPTTIHAFGTNFEKWVDGTEQFNACLIFSSIRYTTTVGLAGTQEGADSYAKEECGSYPSTRFPLQLVVMY